jgi:iron(III) transport system permease protein
VATLATPGGRVLAPPPGVLCFAVLPKAPAWLLTAAIAVSLLMLLPLGFVVWISIQTGWSDSVMLIWRPRMGEVLINTALVVAIAVPICVALGVALAWLTERSDLPGRHVWSAVAVAPLAVPAFVHGYTWVGFYPSLQGLFAGVLVSVLAYFPFLYLPTAAALRRLDPGLEDAAASLGVPPWRVFVRVVLPQLRLPIWGGALIVGLHLLAEYGLFALLRFDTFTTAIFDQFQSAFNAPAANMMAGVLALCCLGLLMLESRTRGGARYARLGPGSARLLRPVRLGPLGTLGAFALLVAVALMALGVPLFTLGRWVAIGGSAIWRVDEIAPVFAQTLGLAAAGAVLTTAAAIPIAWLAVRAPGRFTRLLEGSNYISSAMPGIVIALALVTIAIRVAQPLYQTAITVLLAYIILFLPRALISLRASIAQAPPELENVAQSLGRSPARALWEITLRLAAPGAAAGAAMVFLAITNELTATLLLAPTGTRTLATQFWSLTSEIDYVAAAPYAVIMIALSGPLTWVLYRQSRRLAGQ